MSFRQHAAGITASLLAGLIVIDGDTVHTTDGRKYRLESCDAPETRYARCRHERERGEAAKQRLRQLIQGGYPEVERTGRSCRWGRECVHLHVDGVNVCETLIGEGLAVPYRRGSRKSWCDF